MIRSRLETGLTASPFWIPAYDRRERRSLEMSCFGNLVEGAFFNGDRRGRGTRVGGLSRQRLTADFKFFFQIGAKSLDPFGRGGFKAKDQRRLCI